MAVDEFGRAVESLAARTPAPGTVARVGLGLMVLLAGAHKLLDPGAWTVYVVDWLEPLIVVSPTTFMLANGWLELAFGLALVVDRYTAVAAFVAAVSLSATVGYLTVVWLTAGLFGDIVARDVGLAALAWAVTVDAVRRNAAA
ncbi:DoxX family membrane protein [Halorarius litoreus]|uniref:DoxX family membrane protein n=1 Tax=Halorarius litoreus TaxID=2962676 RepID=UPI0020CDA246|nr:DoxX family membrane protein [Halorarius litoreus]